MEFKENLENLPVSLGRRLLLKDKSGSGVAVIENGPGTAGSFRIYAYLAEKYGCIDANAAEEGLLIYAEHTEDARHYPGKHPNIDRLLEIQSSGRVLSAKIE